MGPVKVTFQDLLCFLGTLMPGEAVLGNHVLLGAVPIEDTDISVH